MAEEWDVSLRILDQTLHLSGRVALWPVVLRYHIFCMSYQKIEMMHQGFSKPGALKRIVCCYFVSVFSSRTLSAFEWLPWVCFASATWFRKRESWKVVRRALSRMENIQ